MNDKSKDKQEKTTTKPEKYPDESMIDETLEESFPASDAPAWYISKYNDKNKEVK